MEMRAGGSDGAMGVVRVTDDCMDMSGAMHMMPCCINHYGPAPVSHFFTPKPTGERRDDMEISEAAFRGRKLLGSTLELPPNYCGYVLEKNRISAGGNSANSGAEEAKFDEWVTQSMFRDMTYWNHDVLPSESDPVPRCFDWLHLSTVIHGSIATDEVTAMVEEQETRGVKRKSHS